jgi:hypothetical protein
VNTLIPTVASKFVSLISHFIVKGLDEVITVETFLPLAAGVSTYKATLIAVQNHLNP